MYSSSGEVKTFVNWLTSLVMSLSLNLFLAFFIYVFIMLRLIMKIWSVLSFSRLRMT